MRYSAILCLAFALSIDDARLAGQSANPIEASNQPSVDVLLADAHAFLLRDNATGVPYRIYVALPADYKNGTKRYATLYALDADGTFALVTQAYRLLKVDAKTPDLVLVGIGYDLPGAERRT